MLPAHHTLSTLLIALIVIGFGAAQSAIRPQPITVAARRAELTQPLLSNAPGRQQSLSLTLQQRLDELREGLGFPGATATVVTSDRRSVDMATGLADIERGIPLGVGGRMLGGSVGKTFVAALVLRLVEDGHLALDAPIARYLGREEWFAELPNGHSATVRMLLDHTSGLPEYATRPRCLETLRREPARRWTPRERLACIFGEEPVSRAGARMHYADTNYILLGAIVERVTRRSYETLLREVLTQAGLAQTEPSDRQDLPGLVVGYSRRLDQLGLGSFAPTIEVRGSRMFRVVTQGKYVFNPQFEWTGGGLLTTAHDLATWAHGLFGGSILQSASLEAMLGSRQLARPRYGLGVEIRHSGFWGETLGHSGWMPGYHSAMDYFPDHGVSIAVQLNTDDTERANARQIVYELMKTLVQAGPALHRELPGLHR